MRPARRRHDIVDPAEARARRRHQPGGGGGIGSIAEIELDLGLLSQRRHRGIDLGVAVAAVEHQAHAARRQGAGDRRADAAGATGDDGNFVAMVWHFVPSLAG